LEEEKKLLQAEVTRLNTELKKLERKMRTSNTYLDRATKIAEAKNTLGNSLLVANAKQRAYTDILLESCPGIIILLDANGCFVLSTKTFLTAVNMPNFDFIKGRNYEEIFSDFFTEAEMEFFRAWMNRISSTNEILMFDTWIDFSKKGQPKFYSIKLRRAGTGHADNPDAPFGTLVVIEDLTDFMYEKQRAEFASKAKSNFLAVMSHEIRTPMNSIIGFSELALNDDIQSKTRDYLEEILDNSHWLLLIINDILDISKIESGKVVLESIPFNLNELFSVCKTLVKPKALEKGISLFVNQDPASDITLLGDPTRLRQVLINLLSNAIKFTDSGTIEVSSSVISSDDASLTIHFFVKDSGIGMTEEQKKSIFQPFMQADLSTTRKYGGTGLGLAISKNLIELMGGEFSVESSPGEGSKFSFDLTFPKTNGTAENMKNKYSAIFAGNPVFEGTVLICEDNTMNQRVICDYLSRVGLKTIVVSNGKEAFNMVQSRQKKGEKPFDLIFMDIHMPEIDGFETASRITQLNTQTPIVALTANNMIEDRQSYGEAGMQDYLSKPINPQALWNCLLKYFNPLHSITSGEILSHQMDEELLEQLKADFVKDNQTTFSKIISAAAGGNIKLAHRLAHTLEGSAGLINEQYLQKAACEAAALLKSGKNFLTETCLNTLETELKSVLEKLAPLFVQVKAPVPGKNAGPASPETEGVSYNRKKALRIIKHIEPMIMNGNPECLDYIEVLRTIPGSQRLIKQMEDFDFNPAIETLAEMKIKLGETDA